MLNREYILEAIRPYLTKDKKLRESDFNRLFSDLTRKEQYQIIEILIDADIDYVDDEASPPIDQKSIIDIFTEIESESIVETKKSHAAPKSTLGRDAKQLLGLKNEQLCALYQQGDPLALEALVLKNEKFVYRDVYNSQLHTARNPEKANCSSYREDGRYVDFVWHFLCWRIPACIQPK